MRHTRVGSLTPLNPTYRNYHVEYPRMEGFYGDAAPKLKKAIALMFDVKHRTIEIEFEKRVLLDNDVNEKIEEVK